MRIQDHLVKLSWTAADKVLFILYGFVNLLQLRLLPTEEAGLWALVNALQTFIITLSDSALLQGMIVFSADKTNRIRVQRFVLLWHSVVVVVLTMIILVLREPLSALLNEPRITQSVLYVAVLCIPGMLRVYCLRLLLRDVQMKQVFWVNAAWIGTMSGLTVWLMFRHSLYNVEQMVLIACGGLICSVVIAVWFTRKQFTEPPQGGQIDKGALRRFAIYQGLTSMYGNLLKQLDIYAIQFFFGAATVGVYQSAKTLFRLVDESINGVVGFFYPGVVRLYTENRLAELQTFISKTLSFLMMTLSIVLVVTLLGGVDFFIRLVLPERYFAASNYFTLMACAAPFLPMMLLSTMLLVQQQTTLLLRYVIISSCIGMVCLLIVGSFNLPHLAPIGLIMYQILIGLFCLHYTRTRIQLPLRLLFRTIPDSIEFLRSIPRKR